MMNSGKEVESPKPIEELVFSLNDATYPFVGVSKRENCQVQLEKMVPRESGRYAEFFTIIGADADRILTLAQESKLVEATLICRRDDGGLFEFIVSGGCPARRLAELGALPQEVVSSNGSGRIIVEVPPGYDSANITGVFLDEFPAADLTAKRVKDKQTPLFNHRELKHAIDDRMTERQREVLRAAYTSGYYERPREKTGAEVAADLGISSATFSQHIRVAERNLLEILYDEDAI